MALRARERHSRFGMMPQMDSLLRTYQKIQTVLKDPKTLDALSEADKKSLLEWLESAKYNWELNSRENQKVPPGNWTNWLLLAGRGYGKTRVGAETVRNFVVQQGYKAVGLIGPTASDARDTMIDGKGGSSLLEVSHPDEQLQYFPTKRRLSWGSGAQGSAFSAEEPERLRGPQHDLLWCDELAAWRYLEETWDMAMFGLRLGSQPRNIITSTPKPIGLLKELVRNAVPVSEMREGMTVETVITRGSTMENQDNLAPQFIETLMKKYEGTRLGRQELYAEILDDNPNALFNQDNIDSSRVERESGSLRSGREVTFRYRLSQGAERPQKFSTVLEEVVVAVDPSMSADVTSDETGIVVMALGKDGHLYVLEDASGVLSPNDWASRVVRLYEKYAADCVVAEVNQGGDLVENTIRTAEKSMSSGRLNYKKVRASKGKVSRAEPVAAMVEQGRVHHVDDLPKLEDQLVTFSPGYQRSPDRLDAYVWGAHHLVIQRQKKGFFIF